VGWTRLFSGKIAKVGGQIAKGGVDLFDFVSSVHTYEMEAPGAN